MVRANALLNQAVRELVVLVLPTRLGVEVPFILQDLPTLVTDLVSRDLLTVHEAVVLADHVEIRAEELAEARRITNRVHELYFLSSLRHVFERHAGVHDQAGRVICTHGARAVRNTRCLEGAGIPSRDGLAATVRDALVPGALARCDCAIADRLAEVGAFRDFIEQLLCSFGVAPLHFASIHQHCDGRARFDRVETELVTESVEVGDVFPAFHRTACAEDGKSFELKS